MATEDYQLEKAVWNADDYAVMGWHDAHIHAVGFLPECAELVFDLDYILKWVSQGPTEPFNFWIAPATLVFHGVVRLQGSVGFNQGMMEFPTILDITQRATEPPELRALHEWIYRIEFDNGELTFHAIGFSQFFRRKPVFRTDSQHLSLQERGGISFDRPTSF